MCSPRVQRWAVTLSAYEYNTVYKPGKHHANADALSRLPVPETAPEREMSEQVLPTLVFIDFSHFVHVHLTSDNTENKQSHTRKTKNKNKIQSCWELHSFLFIHKFSQFHTLYLMFFQKTLSRFKEKCPFQPFVLQLCFLQS